ncbi:SGNH/GDSL hydrolase family protein [Magnetofaba australis]|uniref:SGNH hydrolase-type esterase domain-containing protein n=1 Tax=Magnetofaba australis IT-1 TaxID=1434232 RepID=A0A1Y2K1A1_9PROT|nr:SGNH/GDSL hydrolase family protein [Magnetofaba australis]OSM01811.1 hypothetical protein MAIT1_01850 [Magnetofaba australis IT-1]
MSQTVSTKSNWRFVVVLALMGFGLLEAACFGISLYLHDAGVLYRPQPRVGLAYEAYLKARDPVLGWPSKALGFTGELDALGARVSEAFPDPAAQPALSIYGDSFAYGSEVSPHQAWADLLSRHIGARVNNFGVPGYGTDQAYLRFTTKRSVDRAPVAMLAHYSEDILRNLTSSYDLIYPVGGVGLKPRFRLLQDGSLELIPLMGGTWASYRDVVEDPGANMPADDFFKPGGLGGTQKFGFPFTLRVALALRHLHVQGKLTATPWHAPLYRPDHPSRALDLTAAILNRFVADARAAGVRPLLAIIPSGADLLEFTRSGKWIYATLRDRLQQEGVELLDFGPRLMAHLQGENPCNLFKSCYQHMNPRGNEVLAQLAFEYLQEQGIGAAP